MRGLAPTVGRAAIDELGHDIEVRDLDEHVTAVVRRRMDIAELTSWAAGTFGTVSTHLQRIGVPTVDEPFVRYLDRGEDGSVEVEAGVAVAERITTKDEVTSSSLPAGPVYVTWHRGHPAEVGAALESLEGWMQRQSTESAGAPWAVHHPDPEAPPEAPTWMLEVFQPYRG